MEHLSAQNTSPEYNLDPPDWTAFGKLAHRALDDAMNYLQTVRQRPVWQPVPDGPRARLGPAPVPRSGTPLAQVYQEFHDDILPYPTGNIHPRFWGWVMGTGTADGMVAELMAAAMNAHLAGYNQAPALVEKQCVAWLAEMLLGTPDASGLMVSGGTMANLVGVLVARNAKAGHDVRLDGVAPPGAPPPGFYASTQTHSWLRRSLEVLGLGSRALRHVPVDGDFRINVAALVQQIVADRKAGIHPVCVVGNAGTVNTGAVDDLQALASVCREHGLWFHVDGAFGAMAALTPRLRPMLAGITEADSLAVDLHKWGYVQYEAGCVLVRNADAHRAALAMSADYLAPAGGGIAPAALEFADLGIQLSRGFRALKVWFALRTHGADALGRVIEQNVRHVQRLHDVVASDNQFEVMAPCPLNILCFRYRPSTARESELDALNHTLLVRLQESGTAIISSTRINGKLALRVAHTNHRTRWQDFELLIDTLRSLGNGLAHGG